MSAIVKVEGLRKVYDGGFEALKGVDLEIREGELLALLGPNGAGKTTLISTICGIAEPSGGHVTVGGHDIKRDFRAARKMIGLVPQEIALDAFTPVMSTVRFSRGLYGKRPDDAYLADLLKQLSLFDKRDVPCIALSGGMKRRVLIAKALSHQPRILFLDEPTAGVDVELRKGMWEVIARLKAQGVTIVLTTHYLEEAEEMADRIAIINKGRIGVVEEKAALLSRLGRKELRVILSEAADSLPPALDPWDLSLAEGGRVLVYGYDSHAERSGVVRLLNAVRDAGLNVQDVETRQSSLEEIFVGLVRDEEGAA